MTLKAGKETRGGGAGWGHRVGVEPTCFSPSPPPPTPPPTPSPPTPTTATATSSFTCYTSTNIPVPCVATWTWPIGLARTCTHPRHFIVAWGATWNNNLLGKIKNGEVRVMGNFWNSQCNLLQNNQLCCIYWNICPSTTTSGCKHIKRKRAQTWLACTWSTHKSCICVSNQQCS